MDSPKASERVTAFRLRVLHRFTIKEPMGALDGQTEICQVAGQDGRALVGDHRRLGTDSWGFKEEEKEM